MERRNFMGLAGSTAVASGLGLALASAGAAAASPLKAAGPVLAEGTIPSLNADRIDQIVISNHILVAHGVLDGFGHISVRSATNSAHFFMQKAGVVPDQMTAADIIEYDKDSAPYNAGGLGGPSERFIHGEIYRQRPDVQAIVHSHTDAVLPFGTTKAPLKALIHTAYFLGAESAPVFDLRTVKGNNNNMLVDTAAAGAGLAKSLSKRAVVLMRGHGMSVVAPTVHDAVFRAVYTRANALAEIEALKLGQPAFLNKYEVVRDEPTTTQWNWWASQVQG